MTNQESFPITLTIDGMKIAAQPHWTVLEAAKNNGIFIPTLCAYEGLSPYGGCRLCLVQVEGRPQYLSACTTPVSAGMVIHTNKPEIQALRREMLSLILSEHPAVCFFCPENVFCDSNMTTLCKTEWVTGCHNCPQNGICELQKVVSSLGLTQVKYPALARKYDPETYDPFYDRDYNLCILCGRCIRACEEYRLAEVISFQQRGPLTRVGTAFDRSHLEADCEFCGTCVTVCPTGSLAEKTRKWLGSADNQVQTTCPFCGLGCQIQLEVKGNEVIGSLPYQNSEEGIPQLCVKGRFAAYEVLNQPQRLTKPYLWENGIKHYLTPTEAIQIAAEKLSACPADQFGLALSADCTNEELVLAKKFTQDAMHSPYLENLSRFSYGNSFNYFIKYLNHQAEWKDLENSQVIFSLGFDGRYNQSVVGVKIKQALRNGATLITLHPYDHHLARHAKIWLKPEAGKEPIALQNIIAEVRHENMSTTSTQGIRQAAKVLASAPKRALLIGSYLFQHENSELIWNAIEELTRTLEINIFVLPLQSNLIGSLRLQTFFGFHSHSSGDSSPDHPYDRWSPWLSADRQADQQPQSNWKVLYYYNTAPYPDFPQAEFTILQHISELEYLPSPCLVLPSAAFAEMDGTFLDAFGRLQRIQKAVEPPCEARPAWKWINAIACQMGKTGFEYTSLKDIEKEIINTDNTFHLPTAHDDMSSSPTITQKLLEKIPAEQTACHPYQKDENMYLGVPLREWVGGLDDLYLARNK